MEEKYQSLEQKVSDESCPGSLLLAGSVGALAMFSASAYAGFCRIHPEFMDPEAFKYWELGPIAAGGVIGGIVGGMTGIYAGTENKKGVTTTAAYGLLGIPAGMAGGGIGALCITLFGFGAGYIAGILTQ